MRLLTSLAGLTAVLCLLLASCASGKEEITRKQEGNTVHEAKLLLPRKLNSFSHEEFIAAHKKKTQQGVSTDGKKVAERREENVMHGSAAKGTWREWIDHQGPDKSEYFTMDYGWVKRRRPIHNKQFPYTP